MASRDPNRPNILFILSDDQGPWALNCAGTTELQTPNLDRLATTGIRFENFFCTSPVCSPARASILTGQLPSQHGVQDFLRAGNSNHTANLEALDDTKINTTKKDELTGLDGKSIEFLHGRQTYTNVLTENGYDCALSGKWHIGASAIPQAGFQYWNVHAGGAGNYYDAYMFTDGDLYKSKGYFSDVITDNAISYLDSNRQLSTPFSLNVHFTAPHAPWGREQHPAEYYEDYFANCAFDTVRWDPLHPDQLYKQGSSGTVPTTESARREILSGYFAAITAMDANIGRMLDWLEANDLRDNTLIIFTSDNGMSMGHHGIWGKGNGTYPANMFETAVKVPTIISRPGHVPANSIEHQLLSHYDFFPTILDYTNVCGNSDSSLPGHSFSDLLQGNQLSHEFPVVVFEEYGPTRMIRTKSMKYIRRHSADPNELYDLLEDPLEVVNEIDNPKYADQLLQMETQLQNWFDSYVEPEHDGSKQPVKGRGQIGQIGVDREAFAQDVTFLRDVK